MTTADSDVWHDVFGLEKTDDPNATLRAWTKKHVRAKDGRRLTSRELDQLLNDPRERARIKTLAHAWMYGVPQEGVQRR